MDFYIVLVAYRICVCTDVGRCDASSFDFEEADDAFTNWINELYDSIAERATTQVDGPNGAPLFPIYEMPNRYFDYEEDE